MSISKLNLIDNETLVKDINNGTYSQLNHIENFFDIKASNHYKKCKFYGMLTTNKFYVDDIPYYTFIKNVEQILLSYNLKKEILYSAIWIDSCDLSIKSKSEKFDRDAIMLGYRFARMNLSSFKSIDIELQKDKECIINFIDQIQLFLTTRIVKTLYSIKTDNFKMYSYYRKEYNLIYSYTKNLRDNENLGGLVAYLEYMLIEYDFDTLKSFL